MFTHSSAIPLGLQWKQRHPCRLKQRQFPRQRRASMHRVKRCR
jgi:hypothetical protein